MARSDDRRTEVLEEGDIFFLYRPDVNEDGPDSLDDVQRFHLALRPHGGGKTRLLTLGRKRMPDVESHERNWGFVDAVTENERELEEGLREETYETKTRGEQRRPAARPAGEGVYAISLENRQMHLSYALELPKNPDEVQDTLKIGQEASYVLSVKNPEKGQPKGVGLRPNQKVDYPKKLQEVFRDRRFAGEDVHLLDFEGAEFILVGARTNPESEYGLDLDTEKEDYDHAEIIRKLRMVKSRHPVKPLFDGQWA